MARPRKGRPATGAGNHTGERAVARPAAAATMPSIMHVDMDAFYASVEVRDDASLAGRPVIVGGGDRGVVLSATYQARAFGVRSAMPVARARRMCPGAVVVAPRFHRYAEASAGVMAIFRSLSAVVEPLSMDEAALDVHHLVQDREQAHGWAERVRSLIRDEQQLPCSVGLAPTRLVAKMAATAAKPDGVRVVTHEEVVRFLHPQAVGALWGVGPRTEERLLAFGIRTIGDLARTDRATLTDLIGANSATHLADLSWGVDRRGFSQAPVDRSVGAQHTFDIDVDDPDELCRTILRLAIGVTARARAVGAVGRSVSLTVRFADFSTITRSQRLDRPGAGTRQVSQVAETLFRRLGLQRARVRMVGVRLESLIDCGAVWSQGELELATEPNAAPTAPAWGRLDAVVDRAVQRFGSAIVRPASLLVDSDGAVE